MKYLGLDWGKRKIGVALADDEVKVASPICVLNNKSVQAAIDQIKELITSEEIKIIIVGRPTSLKNDTDVSIEYKIFVARLKELGLRVEEVDERLSTKMAIRLKTQFDLKRKNNDDEVAAALILQTYLDRP